MKVYSPNRTWLTSDISCECVLEPRSFTTATALMNCLLHCIIDMLLSLLTFTLHSRCVYVEDSKSRGGRRQSITIILLFSNASGRLPPSLPEFPAPSLFHLPCLPSSLSSFCCLPLWFFFHQLQHTLGKYGSPNDMYRLCVAERTRC